MKNETYVSFNCRNYRETCDKSVVPGWLSRVARGIMGIVNKKIFIGTRERWVNIFR